jgi:hypothetical protein
MLATVDQSLRGRLILDPARSRPLDAHLRYKPGDPLAVRLSFPAAVSLAGGEVAWVFGRDLLALGLREPAGDGDVHVWPCGPERTMVEFASPQGTALIELRSRDLRDFLRRAYAAVPAGQEEEYLDLDSALMDLFDDA